MTECTVFLNMILKKLLLHYKFYDSLAFFGLSLLFFTGKKKKRSFSLVRDTKSEVLHVPVWTQFYDLGLNAQVDVRNIVYIVESAAYGVT